MPRTPGSSAAESRARILDAALALFRERGFAGTSIRELADHAGMTTAAMYYHFNGKDQILEGLLNPFVEGLRAIGPPPPDRPDVLLGQLIDLFATHGPSIQAIMSDRSAMHYVMLHSDLPGLNANLQRMLARTGDHADLIRAQCALGALQRGLTSTSAPAAGTAAGTVGAPTGTLPAADRAVILAAALAALDSSPE